MQAIQDMNNLKRFIRQAEMSHYALFRCCLFLQSCGNGDVLLQNARAEHSSFPEACGIINVLEEFLSEQAQGTLYWHLPVCRGTQSFIHLPIGESTLPLNCYSAPIIIVVWSAFWALENTKYCLSFCVFWGSTAKIEKDFAMMCCCMLLWVLKNYNLNRPYKTGQWKIHVIKVYLNYSS